VGWGPWPQVWWAAESRRLVSEAFVVNFRHFAVWIIIGLLLFALYNLFQGQSQRVGASDISYSDFIGKVETGEVKSVTIAGEVISGQYNDGRSFQTYAPRIPISSPSFATRAWTSRPGPQRMNPFSPACWYPGSRSY